MFASKAVTGKGTSAKAGEKTSSPHPRLAALSRAQSSSEKTRSSRSETSNRVVAGAPDSGLLTGHVSGGKQAAKTPGLEAWSFGNTPLIPRDLEARMESEARLISARSVASGETHPLLREGLSRARIHTGEESARAAAAQDALAFTVGQDIWFGAGQYRPDTAAGRQLLAHEAVHVAQQMRTGQAIVQRQSANSGQSGGAVQMPPMQVTGTTTAEIRASQFAQL